MVGGATLTKLLGTSAWYAPGASVAFLVKSILNDEKRIIPCSVFLDGEYNQDDICIGVPVVLGKNGIDFNKISFWDFIEQSLVQREKLKFEFTKNLSAALELIASSGLYLGFSRDDVSNLDIQTQDQHSQ